ncbi:MAG: hypothetical protein ACKO85_00520, partial [Isosphaeraceae bacterium]
MKSVVYGPAYLDIVVRVNSPLIPDRSRSIDHGSNGLFHSCSSLASSQIIEISDYFNHKLKINSVDHDSICGNYR